MCALILTVEEIREDIALPMGRLRFLHRLMKLDDGDCDVSMFFQDSAIPFDCGQSLGLSRAENTRNGQGN